MHPRLEAGELAVSTATKDYLFRPSFAAMASLGSPTEIVELFGALYSTPEINPVYPAESYRRWEKEVLGVAYDVLTACCDDDVTPLIGHVGSKYDSWVPGAMPPEHMIPLARSLMKHGITGNIKLRGKPKQEDYTSDFKAKDFVASAIAHLGLSEDEAWNMTMTTFATAMRAKFGSPKEEELNDIADRHDDNMQRLAAINRIRDKKGAK